ncbi:MAG: hypothetical protein FJ395_19190 [Verrucomicrobia bacterium]|nr:hypothetical protein [Verrucomicrobiota bacterium]
MVASGAGKVHHLHMMKPFLLFLLVAVSAIADGVSIREVDGKLRVELCGQLFTEYHYKDVVRPYFYPVIGAGGASMTRDWPMKDTGKDSTDHPHQKGLIYAHGSVNGVDCWSEQKTFGKTVHEKFLKTGKDVISSRNNWVTQDGKVMCSDERTIRFYAPSDVKMLDYEITLIASQGDVTFGDTKEGTMAIRLAETMNVTKTETDGKKKKKVPGDGHIVNSDGVRDVDAWGKRAKWVDYYGPVGGKTVGVAIFDHPKNPRHPTWWHVRDYGLFAVNPFGIHDFEKKPAGAGDLKIESGKSVTFRYRFVFHEGDEKQGRIAERYNEFAKP